MTIESDIIDSARSEPEATTELARQFLYRVLSLASSDPRSARWGQLLDATFRKTVLAACDVVIEQAGSRALELAPGELPPQALDLSALLGHIQSVDFANAEYERVFGLMMSKKCPPYETEYCPQTFSVYRSQRLADIAGFYRAFGLEPSRDMPERHDHISLELEFMAWLIAKTSHTRALHNEDSDARVGVCLEAQVSFLAEHIAWWAPAFAHALWRRAEGGHGAAPLDSPATTPYGSLAQCLASWVAIERARLRIKPPTELVAPRDADGASSPACEHCCALARPG